MTTSALKQTAHHSSSEFNNTIMRQKAESKTAKKPIRSSQKDIEKMKIRKRIEEIELAKSLDIHETDFL